jgi:hypothetical protein
VLSLSAESNPFDIALIPSEPSLFRGETPRNEDDVDGLLSFSEKSVLGIPSEASLLLGESPRDGTEEMAVLLSFSAKSIFFTIALTPSEASRLLGELPLDEAGLLSFSGISMFLDTAPMPPDAGVLGDRPRDEAGEEARPLGLSEDFAVCNVPLDTLDTDTFGEMPGDGTAEENALLSFSVRSMLFDRALAPPVLTGETPRDGIAIAAGLASLPAVMLFSTSAVPFEADDVLGDSPRDEETNRSILSARSMLLDRASAADDTDILLGDAPPRDGISDRAGLLFILSVRSTLLDIALPDTLPPIMAGQRWWSITLACGFSGCSAAPLIGLLLLSAAAASLAALV